MHILAEDVEITQKKYQLAEWLKNELMNHRGVDWMSFSAKGNTLGLSESDINAVKSEFSEVMAHSLFGFSPDIDPHEAAEVGRGIGQELQKFYGHTLSLFTPEELTGMIARRIKTSVQARMNRVAIPVGGEL